MAKKSTRQLNLTGDADPQVYTDYKATCSEYICEVQEWMKLDEEIASRIKKQTQASSLNRGMQIHHIFGRGRNPAFNFFCNLVQVSKAAHDAGHDKCPWALEVCSLKAKLEKHRRFVTLQDIGIEPKIVSPSRWHWNLDSYAAICGSPSLSGRLEGIILPKAAGSVFEPLVRELIEVSTR